MEFFSLLKNEIKNYSRTNRDPNLSEKQSKKFSFQLNLHTKGKNKTRKRRFSGNEFN